MEHVLLYNIESRVENNRSLYGQFQLGPFDRGQALTVANTLRRTLLSELNGLAIVCVEISGVSHEYSHIKGVRESVLDILLNLKQIVFISNEKFQQSEIGFLKIKGPGVVKARDLKLPSFVHCVDPEQYITTLSNDGILDMKFMICEGKNFTVQTSSELIKKNFQSHFTNEEVIKQNFVDSAEFDQSLNASEENESDSIYTTILQKNQQQTNFQEFESELINQKPKIAELQTFRNLLYKKALKEKISTNILFVDAVFMPVTKVNFSIQNIENLISVKSSADNFERNSHVVKKFQNNSLKEKIVLEIWTNGSIHPKDAIYQAVEKIIDIFLPFQKTYFNNKTKFCITILDKNTNSSFEQKLDKIFSLRFKNLNSEKIFLKKSSILNTKQNNSLTPQLNKIYRPWDKNYF